MTPERPGPSARSGLAGRLLLALVLVLTTAAVAAWLVAGAVGPAIFHEHMVRSDLEATESAVFHAEEAFRTAGALALLIALGAALVVALMVSLFLTRRIGTSLAALTSAARLVAGGRYQSEVPTPGVGAEFDELVGAFNHMARRLDASDELRRRLLSDVAHELRTPVATINAELEGLEDSVIELTPETLQVLRDQGSRLTRLAQDLAAVTRAESGEVPLVRSLRHPADLLATAAAAVQAEAEAKGVDIQVNAPATVPAVLVDPDRMGQVLGNLLDNALRHTSGGGSITLTCAPREGQVDLTVTDTGTGIEARHLPHVFERFYRADTARDRTSGGSGIGLAISRAIVEGHGGTITATSDGVGQGSAFTITLPRPGAVTPAP